MDGIGRTFAQQSVPQSKIANLKSKMVKAQKLKMDRV